MKQRLLLLLFIAIFGTFDCVVAQDRNITGTVTELDGGGPIPGVNIRVKGTSRGVVTDVDGRYAIREVDENTILVFSFIGFLPEEVKVGNQSIINVQLASDLTSLSEVVVVGYGTQDRKDLTGSIASVSAKEIQAFPVASLDQAMQGRVPGVQVTSNTGQPGGGVSVRVRGVGTVNNNDPLYVIDGVPVFNDPNATSTTMAGNAQLQNPLAMINPNDIQSMEILKDASATAIYGSRAANGVVIITTKRGSEGKLKVDFETFHGFNQLTNPDNLMDSQTWAGFYGSLLRNSGRENDPNLPTLDQIATDPNARTYNWVDAGTQRGMLNNYQLNLSGGNQTSKFFIAGNYYNEEGTVINSGFKRYSLRLNTDHNLTNKIKVGNTLSLTRTDQLLGPTGIDNTAIFQRLESIPPIRPVFTEDGNFAEAGPIVDANSHFIANLYNDRQTLVTDRILGSVFGEIELLEGLSFRSVASIDQISATQQLFNPPFEVEGDIASRFPENSSLTVHNRNSFTWFTDNYFTYKKTFADRHDLTLTLGHSSQLTSNKFYTANVQNFISANQPYLDAGINQGNVGGGEQRNSLVSYFTRFSYILDNKYMLTGTVRRDGSSRFGENNRFGTFPAFSAGWRVSEEDFLKNVDFISDLKLRGSWGLTGGQEIGNYSAFNTLGTNFSYIFGDQLVGGFAPLSLANPNLQWEATEQTNFGIDMGLFNNRVSITADYFIKNTTKLLLRVQPPVEEGTLQNPFANLGEIQNKGFELGINTVNIDRAFGWNSNFNFTAIRNEVLALANDNADRFTIQPNSNFNSPTFVTSVGGSIGQFFVHEVEGIFQSWEEVYSSAIQNTPRNAEGQPSLPQTNTTGQTSSGDLKFRDINGDGVIDDDDRVVAGNIIPDFTWGFTNNFSYKGIGLSIFMMGVHGVDIYNGARAARERMNAISNQRITVLDAWTPENTDTSMPRAILTDPNNNNRASTRWIEDGSFIRIKNIRLSYDLPQSWLEKAKVANAHVYISTVNAFTFTKYTGYDPELGNHNQNPELGNLDAGQYPQARQFLLGLRLGF